jgi:diaminopimelate decarboxylase
MARELAPYIRRVRAVNFGGGHFVCKQGYDVDALIRAVLAFRAEFDVEVILEPGSGLVVDAGYLVATVLDVVHNEADIAVLDASAAATCPTCRSAQHPAPSRAQVRACCRTPVSSRAHLHDRGRPSRDSFEKPLRQATGSCSATCSSTAS